MPKVTQLGATHHVDPAPAPTDPGDVEVVEAAAEDTVAVLVGEPGPELDVPPAAGDVDPEPAAPAPTGKGTKARG